MKKKTTPMICRQGDVLIMRVTNLPGDAIAQKRDESERIILAHGELTGHAHAIHDRGARLLETAARAVFLEITDETASLVHEEHSTVSIPPGIYRVLKQTEYSPEALRSVAD